MGNKLSSGAKEEAELRHRISVISTCLQEHENAIFGICHSVETQAATIEILSNKISKIVSVHVMKASEKPNDGLEQIICCHCSSEWQEKANVLLCSVQSSLRLQSKSLYSTFKRLKDCICETKNHYKLTGCGTSVDLAGNDRFCIDYLGSPKTDYVDACNKLEEKINALKTLNVDLKLNNSKYDQQLKEMKQKNENLNDEKEEQTVQMRNEKKRLETYIHEMEEKAKGQEVKIKDIEDKFKSQEEKILDMGVKLKEKREKMHNMEEKLKGQEEKLKDMQNEIKGLRVEKISLEQDIDDMKKTIPVQLFHNLKGGMIPTLLYELKTMIATQMQMKRHEIQFVICQTETDVNPKIPVFVFCINASRLGTDAASAIQNLKVSSKVSILVFHHKDVHALPSQASERVLTEPEFKELGGIFDIAFLADKGIYACDMNHATAVGIENFLRTQS